MVEPFLLRFPLKYVFPSLHHPYLLINYLHFTNGKHDVLDQKIKNVRVYIFIYKIDNKYEFSLYFICSVHIPNNNSRAWKLSLCYFTILIPGTSYKSTGYSFLSHWKLGQLLLGLTPLLKVASQPLWLFLKNLAFPPEYIGGEGETLTAPKNCVICFYVVGDSGYKRFFLDGRHCLHPILTFSWSFPVS